MPSSPSSPSRPAAGQGAMPAGSAPSHEVAPGVSKDVRALQLLLLVLCAALALVVAGNSALAIALPGIAADLSADQGSSPGSSMPTR